MTNLVEIKKLTKRFGTIVAVDGVSFNVERGTVLGFLGPNGAGKSTTMKIITGFLTPDAGQVVIAGEDLSDHPVTVKRRIGYLPEGAPLYADMTPARFLEFVAEVRGYRGDELRRRIADAVAKINLETVLDRPIETLSKGFKRRVGIAQAILHDPEVLVLDEPTDGLDPNQKHEVRALIREMAQDKAIVLSTHILEEVDAVCTHAAIIASGRIVADGTPAELEARSPRHNAVTLAISGDNPGIRAALEQLPNVSAVESTRNEQLTRYVIYAADGRPIIDHVSTAARDGNWPVEELHVERGRLDDIFRSVTQDIQAVS